MRPVGPCARTLSSPANTLRSTPAPTPTATDNPVHHHRDAVLQRNHRNRTHLTAPQRYVPDGEVQRTRVDQRCRWWCHLRSRSRRNVPRQNCLNLDLVRPMRLSSGRLFSSPRDISTTTEQIFNLKKHPTNVFSSQESRPQDHVSFHVSSLGAFTTYVSRYEHHIGES